MELTDISDKVGEFRKDDEAKGSVGVVGDGGGVVAVGGGVGSGDVGADVVVGGSGDGGRVVVIVGCRDKV